MVIRLKQNQYRGINAHLNSELQSEAGGWEGFHGTHITHIAESLDSHLPSGYLLDPERSLQIREYHPSSGERVFVTQDKMVKPDIAANRPTPSSGALSAPTLTLPANEAVEIDPEIYLTALVIREITGSGKLGRPVTWIELLSPTNKPPRAGYAQYHEKRIATLQTGIVLVEIDYLHASRSPIHRLPSYLDHAKDSYPYTIVVTDPRPSLEKGKMNVYGFGVDDPMPVVELPLKRGESVTLDLGAVYTRTFESLGTYSYLVDYEQEPPRMSSYSKKDRKRIRALMSRVIAADDNSDDE